MTGRPGILGPATHNWAQVQEDGLSSTREVRGLQQFLHSSAKFLSESLHSCPPHSFAHVLLGKEKHGCWHLPSTSFPGCLSSSQGPAAFHLSDIFPRDSLTSGLLGSIPRTHLFQTIIPMIPSARCTKTLAAFCWPLSFVPLPSICQFPFCHSPP